MLTPIEKLFTFSFSACVIYLSVIPLIITNSLFFQKISPILVVTLNTNSSHAPNWHMTGIGIQPNDPNS